MPPTEPASASPVPLPAVVLGRRSSVALLAAMAVASLLGLLVWGPVGLSTHTHAYADERTLFGVPHAMNVWTHMPLLPLGLWGLWRVRALPAGESLRLVWALFFLCQMLATIGGMAYHWAPHDTLFVWDQMPKSAACALMSCAFLAERVDERWGAPPAVFGALLLSAAGGLWCWATLSLQGEGDLRPLLWLEFMPTALVATGAWNLSGRLLTRGDWMRSLFSFVFAQTVDWADRGIYVASGWISGHSIRHLALAACVAWIAYRLGAGLPRRREDGADADGAAPAGGVMPGPRPCRSGA